MQNVIKELRGAGVSLSLAQKIVQELSRELPRAKRWARQETLYRPQNRLADLAIRLGCPRDSAMSVALAIV